jgi:hypothetical protein
MKKIYRFLCIGIMAAMPGAYLQAQLNGVYTIDNTQAVSATNFTSFTQFTSTLNAQGVSGPVTVNVGVASGPYNEQIDIIQYAGSSATNSVVINGNGRTITFNATSAAMRHTIMLSGADYMVWNNLRVIGTHATNALVVHLWNGSDYNIFNNMYIEAPNNGTSTTQVPFSISGSNTSPTSAGNAGNMNVVNSSTIIGGYYNTVFYGNTGAPFNTGNEVRNSVLRDFYIYGFYNAYCTGSKVLNNLVDRVNRITISSTYGIYLTTGSNNCLVEGNLLRDVFANNIGASSLAYLIYIVGDGTATAPNLIRNNVVSDINSNGTIIGIYLSGSDYAYAEHNTISIDYTGATGGTSYGIYSTGSYDRVRNNNISINRGGTGSRWGLYYTTTAANIVSDYNNIYVGVTTSPYGVGYYNATYTTLANWQAGTIYDQNSVSVDPQFVNPASYDYSFGNVLMNNKALPIGVLNDVTGLGRFVLAPDPGAYESFNSPCGGTPSSNYFIVPSISVCPGAQIELTLQNTKTYTNTGYVVQWNSSTTSTVGPFTSIPGATLNSYVTSPVSGNVHYQAVITCTNSNQSINTPPGSVLMMPLVQDTVPYFESFEVLGQNGLPNCYWSASSMGISTRVSTVAASGNRAARTGTNYAYFENKPIPNYFYSNQIFLKAGVTYSAALWYITENIGFNQWPDLSILIGTSQTPAGLNVVASASPVTGQLYNLLSNTFSVATTAYYYVAVRAQGGQGVAPFLTWDDLSITIPCSLNSPVLSVIAPTAQVCQGLATSLQAGGADTYSWSNGTQGPANVVSPVTHSTYIVYGFNTLSGCATSVAINLTVAPAPAIGAIASDYSVCSGQSTTLTATGGDSYYWSTGSTSAISVVNPTITSTYYVAGTNSAGCTGSTQVVVNVLPSPVLTAKTTNSVICLGEAVQLSALGASSYVWLAPNLYTTGSEVTVTPQSSTIYTVTGTTQEGCTVTSQVFVVVNECTGVAELSRNDFRIFPNPATDQLFVQTHGTEMVITITDVSGRVVASQVATSELTSIELREFSAGVYYVRLVGDNYDRTEKFIRQ